MQPPPSLWKCPLCFIEAKGPTKSCSQCGCNLLLLAKIKIEAWQALARAEEARALFLSHGPPPALGKKSPWTQSAKELLIYLLGKNKKNSLEK